MHSAWLTSTFLRVFKFLQIKEWGPNFWVEPIFQKVWIIWSPLLYLKFKSFVDLNSSSFIRFQCILHDWRVLFPESWNFYKLKRGDLISGANQFWRRSELFGPPFCISILKVLQTQILRHSLDFNPFCMIQEYCSQTPKISRNKWRGDLISGRNQFWRKSELFGPPFCISILKVLWIQIHLHSLDLMHSAWLRSTFLRVLKYLQIKEGGPNFWGEPILQKVWIIWCPLLYLDFKSFVDRNSLSFIRFQCILHDSGVLYSGSWNFYKLNWGDLISGWNQFGESLNDLVHPAAVQY